MTSTESYFVIDSDLLSTAKYEQIQSEVSEHWSVVLMVVLQCALAVIIIV